MEINKHRMEISKHLNGGLCTMAVHGCGGMEIIKHKMEITNESNSVGQTMRS
jgi:hypothetical protein